MGTSTSAVATYTVTGMTCGHCVSSVEAELGRLDGVTDVAVDLASGRVTVTADAALEEAAVAAAIDEAGYGLVPTETPAAGASCCGSCH
ncbi:heavy-metal-associated domain-containing protein [Embleya scabrispora]|uniref:heavy-metal-associated domain-containing protein n=1 Tax=Embleya scabrispora TaxID=159449 RepID=UPI000365F236|nr:cation transporter [Embleya scabrispora]MYS80900.1 regulator [Streptomyces sp. SID5474]